jgi:hypothetical protein
MGHTQSPEDCSTLGSNDRVNETFGITVELDSTSHQRGLVVLGIWWKLICEHSESNIFSHAADG